MRLGLDRRTVALGVIAVALALLLGGLAGTSKSAAAGAWAALAGLVPPALLAVAVELRARNAAHVKRQQELLRLFAPAEPVVGRRPEKGTIAELQVTGYLRPENRVVSFRRRPELGELLDWCGSAEHAGIRLMTGPGGAGKTRLAMRLGEELAVRERRPLWVPRGKERDAFKVVRDIGRPSVLVVDYAETRDDLAGLLNDVAGDREGPDLRILLLARSSGEW